MLKSEYALQQVEDHLRRADAPVEIESGLIDRAWLLTDDGDPRWIGVALTKLNSQGRLAYPKCSHEHYHDSACTVQLVTA
jgi:hypothetical protein